MKVPAISLVLLLSSAAVVAAAWDHDEDWHPPQYPNQYPHPYPHPYPPKPYKCGQVSPNAQIKTDGHYRCIGPGEVLCRDYDDDTHLPVDGVYKFGIDASDPKGIVKLWDGHDNVVWSDWEGAQELCILEKPTCLTGDGYVPPPYHHPDDTYWNKPPQHPYEPPEEPSWWEKPGKRGLRSAGDGAEDASATTTTSTTTGDERELWKCDNKDQPYLLVCGEGGCKPSQWHGNGGEVRKIAEVKCVGVGNSDFHSQLKLVDLAEHEPNYHEPFSIVKFKRGTTPNPYDENELFAIKLFPPTSSWYRKYGHFNAEAVVNPKFCELIEYTDPHPPKEPTHSPVASPTYAPSSKPSKADECLFSTKVIDKDSGNLEKGDELGYSVSSEKDIVVLGLPGAGGMYGALAVLDLTDGKVKVAFERSKGANSRAGSAVSTDGYTVAFGAPAYQPYGAFGYADVDHLYFVHPTDANADDMMSGISTETDALSLFPIGAEDSPNESRNWNIQVPDVDPGLCGASIAVDGPWLVLGCPGISKVRLYYISGGNPDLRAVLDGHPNTGLGTSVALDKSSGYLAAGAPKANGGKGEVFIYKQGQHIQTLYSPVENGAFGQSIALINGVIVVGAPGAYDGKGAAYVYYPGRNGWEIKVEEESVLTAHDGTTGDHFGSSVAIDASSTNAYTIIVGAHKANSYAGAAYFFKGSADGTWYEIANIVEKAYISDSSFTLNSGDKCGFSVDVSGNRAIIGCPGDHYSTGAVLFIKLDSCHPDEY